MWSNLVNKDCLFCRIVEGDIPAVKIYETQDILAFFDAFPAAKGHCLVIPKGHYESIDFVPDNVISSIFTLAKKIVRLQKKIFNINDVNLLQNNGREAGQTVFHMHLHIIPRFKNDNVNLSWKENAYENDNEILTIANKMKEGL